MATAKERLQKKRREYRWAGVLVMAVGLGFLILIRAFTESDQGANIYYYGQASVVPVLGLALFISSFIIKK